MKPIQNQYLQYKPYKYVLDGEYIKSSHKYKSSVFKFEPFAVSLESIIQKIDKKDLPTNKEDWSVYCLDMVNEFGFLNINKYVKSSHGFFNYEKEHIIRWKSFVIDLKNIIQNKEIDKIEVMNSYLIEDTHLYFDDFHVKNLSYKCNSLASAIILYIITNKKHSKNCLQCNGIFFAKRSDALYCNANCSKAYQRKNQTNKCLN